MMALPVSQLSYYDVATRTFIVVPGIFNVMVDIRLRKTLRLLIESQLA